ncbi:hypothetical protein [Desulfovibrio gilichinskyi]|uniref:Uncharacterized protein n=1 Tax=Desulfovibrio gilichinskyi TaxID=1519643 RepID=A0A1X7D6L5_9BACT|nr:hypothetical protein [Desulfovibrio gilichinskyi]SMF09910.1 hypothetical protein SAMN06295933_1732 [Desulfovibrio gilichinskyi]
MAKKTKFWKYLINESELVGILLIVFVPVSFLLSNWDSFEFNKNFLTQTWNIFEPIVGSITLGVAIVLYVANLREAWEEDLPKLLTAEFRCNDDGSLIMRADNVPFAEESDIRAWGQQLGAQMSGANRGLKYFRIETSERISESGDYKEYKIVFFLREIPEEVRAHYDNGEFVNIRDKDGKLDLFIEERC